MFNVNILPKQICLEFFCDKTFMKMTRLCRMGKSEQNLYLFHSESLTSQSKTKKHQNPIRTKDSSQSHLNERIPVKDEQGQSGPVENLQAHTHKCTCTKAKSLNSHVCFL